MRTSRGRRALAVPRDLLSARGYEEKQGALRRTASEHAKAVDLLASRRTAVESERRNLMLRIDKAQREIAIADALVLARDNKEVDDIKRSFLLAGVPEFDADTDIGFVQVLRTAAALHGVKHILEGHNTKAEVDSELGRGSVFSFKLPRFKTEPES